MLRHYASPTFVVVTSAGDSGGTGTAGSSLPRPAHRGTAVSRAAAARQSIDGPLRRLSDRPHVSGGPAAVGRMAAGRGERPGVRVGRAAPVASAGIPGGGAQNPGCAAGAHRGRSGGA